MSRQSVYDKLKRLEPQVPAALVHYSGEALLPCVKAMGSQAPPLLPRYRVRVLDGNHLAGTEHRIFELRRFRAAAWDFRDFRAGMGNGPAECAREEGLWRFAR